MLPLPEANFRSYYMNPHLSSSTQDTYALQLFWLLFFSFIDELKIVMLAEGKPGCSVSVLLPCISNGASSIFFQVLEYNEDRFSSLTSARISKDPDYNETQVNGSYTLQVIHTADHNGSLYRCTGFFNGARVYSNEVQLLLTGEYGVRT